VSIEGPDPPRDRTADATVAVVQDDVRRIFHGLEKCIARGLKQAGDIAEQLFGEASLPGAMANGGTLEGPASRITRIFKARPDASELVRPGDE